MFANIEMTSPKLLDDIYTSNNLSGRYICTSVLAKVMTIINVCGIFSTTMLYIQSIPVMFMHSYCLLSAETLICLNPFESVCICCRYTSTH